MSCDLCGKSGLVSPTKIEGMLYKACAGCAAYGEKVATVPVKKKRTLTTDTRVVRADAAVRIRDARNALGKTQHDFAMLIGIKESDLHAFESSHRVPTLEMATRLEKQLHITLIQEIEEKSYSTPSTSSGGALTIADLLKKK